MDLTVRTVRTISGVDRGAWDALDHGQSPFLEWGFLAACEQSGSIGEASGWDPHYVLVEAGSAPRALVGAVACFQKEHSYGEYIFDWAWARAASQGGIRYYPKLVVAAPVTPASGPRLLLAPGLADPAPVVDAIVERVRELADQLQCSSIHWLFTTPADQAHLTQRGFLPRASYQFHWRNDGYESFEDFLSRLSSRKRKQIRKERRRARAGVDAIEFVAGPDLDEGDLGAMDRFYRRTVQAHGGMDYLQPGFFHTLREVLGHRIQFVRVRRGQDIVAGALYLETESALYGRYWGCDEELDCLHFETAYYAGIERAIDRGLDLFEAGAQGEHKLLRGFLPSVTNSSHWIRNRGLAEGVRRFLVQEAAEVDMYTRRLAEFAPFKKDG